MKYLLLIPFFLTSCSFYQEQFTYKQDVGHTVNVTHFSFLLVGKAAKLTTETQTEEFIREVNTQDLEIKPDAEAIKGFSNGVVNGIKSW